MTEADPPRLGDSEDPKQVEAFAEALLERDSLHRFVLDRVSEGVVTTDAHGTVVLVNRAARALLKTHPPYGHGEHIRDLLGLHSSPQELVAKTSKLSYVLPRDDGEEVDLELSVAEHRGARGSRFIFILRDVHEEKRRSAERERFERLAMIGTMVAGFAHEVRNPVAALRSLAESLAEELGTKGGHLPHLTRMLAVLERIERLVRTSLQFGRPATPRRAHHRPWTLLAGAMTEMSARTRQLGGEVRIEVEPDLPDVFVDEGQGIQILVILVNNALDVVGSPSRVLVRVTLGAPLGVRDDSGPSSRPSIRFDVHDDGPGIPPEILERIFDPFFTTKPSGTGLGLSIAQQLAVENAGRLEVSAPREGPTVFSLVLPSR